MYKIIITFIICFSCFIISSAQVSEYKLLPSVSAENDGFGGSVSIDGDYAVVGAPAGEKIFVFRKSGADWIEQSILTGDNNPPGSTLNPLFGSSVNISGSYIIVGAPFQVFPPITNTIGGAYIFKRSGEDWVRQIKIQPPEAHPFGLFGWSVAISDFTAVVGEADRGKTHLYRRSGEDWTLYNTFSGAYRFGESVSISGNYIAAGAVGGDIFYEGQGSICVFFNDGLNWLQQAWLQSSDGSDVDAFGNAVSVSNSTLIGGDSKAVNDDSINTGAAYIFSFADTSWMQIQKLAADDGSAGDSFGSSVSISDNFAVISAPEDQDNGTKSGSAYIYLNDGGNWRQAKKLLAGDGEAYDNFGISVSISGDYAIVGANGDDDNGINAGAAYIYSNFPTGLIHEKKEFTSSFVLKQNYPNPFNPTTKIKYKIPVQCPVNIKVYDFLGREVATLANLEMAAGSYEVEFSANGGSATGGIASALASGIYFYKLQAGTFSETKKMILLK